MFLTPPPTLTEDFIIFVRGVQIEKGGKMAEIRGKTARNEKMSDNWEKILKPADKISRGSVTKYECSSDKEKMYCYYYL